MLPTLAPVFLPLAAIPIILLREEKVPPLTHKPLPLNAKSRSIRVFTGA
jgi:hypothetical protein